MVQGKAHICPADRRRFSTAAGLRQHRLDAHGSASAVPRKRRRAGAVSRVAAPSRGMQITTTSGTDLVGLSLVAADKAVNSLLFSMPVNPFSQSESRLGKEGELWQRWRPTRLRIRALGAGPMTSGGSYVLSWHPDGTPSFSNENLAQVALAAERSVVARFDTGVTFDIPVETTQRWLLTNGEEDQTAHGTLLMVLISAPNGVKGTVAIPITLEWSVQWQGRKLSIQGSDQQKIWPDSGYTSLFTTSDSSFDSTVLTFKMHAGGSAVPFHQARPGTVYTTKGTGTTVPYVKSDSTNGVCEYFSRAIGFDSPILVLHLTAQEGYSYQRTGDKQHCLVYKAAGTYVKPSKPEFVAVSSRDEVRILTDRVHELETRLQGFHMVGLPEEPQSD